MKKLTEYPKNTIFYRGTIIVLKNVHNSPKGRFDVRYGMILIGGIFEMLDLYRSMGSPILHSLEPNVYGALAVDIQGVRKWVAEYFESFYGDGGKEVMKELGVESLEDLIYIEDLADYFVQANRDLFMIDPDK
jgi:hypothetical protein